MSRRAQPARDCKKAKSVSSSDTVFSSESGITGGSSTQSVIGVSNPVGDSCSISGSCVISSPHGISFCSSRSSLSSEGTLTGRMEDDYQEEQSLEDRELGAGRVLPSSGDSQVDVLLDSLLARLNSGLRRRYGNEPDRVPVGGGASGGVDKNRLVEKLAPYSPNTDIAAWIKKLEDDLDEIGIASNQYKAILTRKITSGRALCIVSSIERSECTYAELKRKLIDGLGSDLTTLGIKLISEFQSTVRSVWDAERLRQPAFACPAHPILKLELMNFILCFTCLSVVYALSFTSNVCHAQWFPPFDPFPHTVN